MSYLRQNQHPQLTISTQAGPSTPTPPPRRPQGARRRGVAPGLYVANPDNSDEDPSPPKSGSQRSPAGSVKSIAGVSPISVNSQLGRLSGGSSSVSILPPPAPGSPSLGKGPGSGGTVGGNNPSLFMPTIPAPQSSPLPSISAFPSPQALAPTPGPSASTFTHYQENNPVPPQPPPHPERHLRRAFTTPVSDQVTRPTHEPRTASGSNVVHHIQHSPSRALPPLPSPPINSSGASPIGSHSPSFPFANPQPPSSAHPLPTPSSDGHGRISLLYGQSRVASPEDALSPAVGSDGSASIMSVGMGNRARSGSVQGHLVRLQVTTDNEAFHLVDITGIDTADGIREKVFSKLRIRDEDHPTLSLYRTEIGEPADEIPILPAALLNLCSTQGDSKASLKFLVKQTDVPPSSAASVIPPLSAQSEVMPYRSVADNRRAGMPQITTDLSALRNTALNRPSSRHSKEGSVSSASGELVDRGALSASDWSDLGPDADEWTANSAAVAQIRRATRNNFVQGSGRHVEGSNGSSRSPRTEPTASIATSSPSLPTPPAPFITQLPPRDASSLSSPSRQSIDPNHPASPPMSINSKPHTVSSTPIIVQHAYDDPVPYFGENAAAGPSRSSPTHRNTQGLGLALDDMDPDTRALIQQLQREEEEAQQADAARRLQLEQDEELARKEQQSERDIWQMMQQMQLEQQQALQAQIAGDEQRAREVQAEQDREDEVRQAREAARAAWDAEQREQQQSRFHTFEHDRRSRSEHFRNQAQMGRPPDDIALHEAQDGSLPNRRTSDPRAPASRQTPGPLPPRQPSILNQPIYQSSPTPYAPHAPTAGVYSQSAPPRRPTGFPEHPYQEAAHAQERLSDPRLQQVTGYQGSRSQTGSMAARTADPRLRHPFGYTSHDQTGDHLQAPAIQNARSMDNLRPYSPQAPTSRPPYQGLPARSSLTPTPGGYLDRRSYQNPSSAYRSPSMDRVQDGRYPDPVHSAPSRAPPLHIPSPDNTLVPFPLPHPSSAGDASPATWRNQLHQGFNTLPRSSRTSSYDTRDPLSGGRPQTVHYDRSPTLPTSPQTATAPRPATYYDDDSPPRTARTFAENAYQAQTAPTLNEWGRPRSGSASGPFRPTSPLLDQPRRVSESSVYADDRDTQLPYANPSVSPESSWLSVARFGRSDTDTLSVAGTVSSDATVRPRGEDGDSTDTAKAGIWDSHIRDMIGRMGSGSGEETVRMRDGDEDEATLWITAPTQPHESPRPLSRSLALRPSASKPNLIVDTAGVGDTDALGTLSTTTPSDGATESEGTGEGTGVRRGKSFAEPKDPGQWDFRPDPETLYENLDEVFPKIDLDRPFVEGVASTPSTPAADSPNKMELAQSNPPPLPPRSAQAIPSPINEEPPRPATVAAPQPAHTSTSGVLPAFARSKFNKAEARRSIRVVADNKRRTLQRELKEVLGLGGKKDVPPAEPEQKKVQRRSSSMWDHKLVEVTPSKLAQGHVPATIPESPAADGKPGTVNWVKGELIGKGSYGRVYIALNATTGDMMAVKQVELPATERDRYDKRQLGMIEALRAEIELLKGLEHPNIVAYLGYETSPEFLSIFLEYVPGGTIASIYRTPNQGRFEHQLVRFFTEQILEGLAYLHSRNIWHRDLKGDNILVDAHGICKISDFGISKQTSDAYDSFGQATNMKGSVFWMAPEVIHSATERTYSGKVDIWSLGCVVLEMWSGKRPWGEMEQVAAMFELFNKRARPPLPPDIHLSDIALDFLNNKCLATDPRDRPVARDLLQHRFILDKDPNWTFEKSNIGKAITKKEAKRMRG